MELESQPRKNRRARLVGIVAIGAAATLLLAACGGTSTASKTGGAGAYGMTGLTGAKAAGDTLTVGEPNAPNSLDPSQVYPQPDYTAPAYESLTYLSQKGVVQPALATSWKYIGTGNTDFQMTIRKNVKFSDGTALTPQAVVNSLKYVQSSPGPESAFLTGATFSVSGDDVAVKLKTANPVLPQIFSQVYDVGAIISAKGIANPKDMDAAHTSYGVGRYIYQPSQSVAGDHYTYTANPNYYDKSQVYFKTMVLKVVSSSDSLINAVKAGQIDVAKGDFTGIDAATKAGLQAVGGPTNAITMVLTDRGGKVVKALGNVKVRQALNYAIDRATITKALVGSYGTATQQFALKGGDGYSSTTAKAYPYDPAKAKKLLKEAGYAKGFSFDLITAPFAGFNDVGEAIQGQLAKVGVTVNIKEASNGLTYVQNSASTKYPAFIGGQSALPMYNIGLQLFMTSPNENPFNTTSTKLTSLFNQAAAAEPTERKALDQKITEYLSDNAWFVPIAATPIVFFGSPTIGGMGISANNTQPSVLDWYRLKS